MSAGAAENPKASSKSRPAKKWNRVVSTVAACTKWDVDLQELTEEVAQFAKRSDEVFLKDVMT